MADDLEVITPQKDAETVRSMIYEELEGTTLAAFKLEQSWVRLGILLSEFKQKEHWRALGYLTYDAFIKELKDKFKRGRTILYGYVGAVEALLPIMTPEELEQVGISKCLELKRAQKLLNGKPLPPSALEAAVNTSVTASDLRGELAKATLATEDERGIWFDLQGIFLTPEERKEFKEVFLATEGLLGIKTTVPDHIRRKEVLMAWMKEFWGTHSAEWNGVEQPPNAEPVLIQEVN